MRRLLTQLLILAVVIMIAAPAGAKGKPPTPDPLPDGMCAAKTLDEVVDIADEPTLTGTLDCVDVFFAEDAKWEFTVEITGARPERINTVSLHIREAHPGDFCWFWAEDPRLLDDNPTDEAITFVVTTDVVIPASVPPAPEEDTKNVCSEDSDAFEDPTDSLVATLRTFGSKKASDATTKVTIRPVP